MNENVKKSGTRLERAKKYIWRQRFFIAAFLVPFFAMFAAFAVHGVYPFGERQIAVVDMYHQYLPFFSELQYKLQNGGSLMYSWNGGGGYNFLGVISYYAASPLNLLLLLFPASLVMEGVTLILLLKVGAAGAMMYLYLSKAHDISRELPAVAFASMYALSSYVMCYYWCTMWIDVVALLPLCILGLRKLVNEGKATLYSISLGMALFCNYYIGYMLCLFVVLYYLAMWFADKREGGFRHFALTSVKFGLHSVIGAGLAGLMLIPAYMVLQRTFYTETSMPDKWEILNEPLKLLNQLLPNAQHTSYAGLPNLYCGLAAVILLICYYSLKSIKSREKISYTVLLAVMFLSLMLNKTDFIWHGFHFPNNLPARYSFVISFVLVEIAYRTFCRFEEISESCIYFLFIGIAAFYMYSYHFMPDAVDNATAFIVTGLILLFLYTVLMIVYKKKKISRRLFTAAFSLLVVAEMILSAYMTVDKVGTQDRTAYRENHDAIAGILSAEGKKFARTEIISHFGPIDMPALHHYRGISQFASTMDSSASEMMRDIGISSRPSGNRYDYYYSNPLTNAMLGLKFFISEDADKQSSYIEPVYQNEDLTLYENKYPLSLGYMLPASIENWAVTRDLPYDNLNDFAELVAGRDAAGLFEDVAYPVDFESSIDIEEKSPGHYVSSGGEGKRGEVKLYYDIDKDGLYYLYADVGGAAEIQTLSSDGEINSNFRTWSGVGEAGTYKKADKLTVKIVYNDDRSGDISCRLFRLNEKKWRKLYDVMSRNQMQVDDYSDTYIKGSIDAEQSGVLCTSVLYDKGWRVYVDGVEPEEIYLIGGDFIGIELGAGQHDIEFKYRSPGLLEGLLISLQSIILLVLLHIMAATKPTAKIAESSEDLGSEVKKKEENDGRNVEEEHS